MASEWRTVRLGDVCSKIGSGATPRGGSSVYIDHGEVALIRSQNIYNDGFHHDGITYLTAKHAAELANVEVVEHDVLLNITGDSVARACQVDPKLLPARVNQHVAIVRPNPDVLLPGFLRYYLVSPAMQAEMLSLAGAGATRNALTKGMIESFELLAPGDIEEQRAIAHILGTLDEKIDLNRRMNETLEAIARAIFKSWFVDFDPVRAKAEGRDLGLPENIADLFPDSFEESEMGEIPKGWRVGTVDDVAKINAQTLSRTDTLDVIDYIEISEVMRGDIGTIARYERGAEPSRARRRLRHGDAVISTVRPDRGAHFLCLTPPEMLVASTGFAVVSPRDGNWAFLYAVLTRREVSEELARLADGGAYPAVRPEAIGALNLFIPKDPRTLTAFQKLAAPLFERSHQNRAEAKTLASLRDALLPQLISGELRVSGVEKSDLESVV